MSPHVPHTHSNHGKVKDSYSLIIWQKIINVLQYIELCSLITDESNLFDQLNICDYSIEDIFETIYAMLDNVKYLQLTVVKAMLQSLAKKIINKNII